MLAGIFALCSVLLILLVLYADTACIGPDGTSIGLSHLNEAVFKLFGVNILWYHITDWLGFAALITGFAFSMMGLVQLIKRRSFIKVDKEILLLGGLYLLVGYKIGAAAYLLAWAALMAVASALLLRWLNTKGAATFAAL